MNVFRTNGDDPRATILAKSQPFQIKSVDCVGVKPIDGQEQPVIVNVLADDINNPGQKTVFAIHLDPIYARELGQALIAEAEEATS